MYFNLKTTSILISLCFVTSLTHAQLSLNEKSDFKVIDKKEFDTGKSYYEFEKVSFTENPIQTRTANRNDLVSFYFPSFEDPSRANEYLVKKSNLLPQSLQEKYPNIQVYVGYLKANPSVKIRFDYSAKGLNVAIYNSGETYYWDSKKSNDFSTYYKVADYKAAKSKNFECRLEELLEKSVNEDATIGYRQADEHALELRTFRIAIATTGEYTQYHGGTKEDALAAIVSTLNRVTGIYERDLGVTFTLIENNDEIIYTDASTDPYDQSNFGGLLSENVNNLNNTIGSGSFDVGHLFCTSNGGVAYLGSVCNSNKAGGITGLPQPEGDPFDVDYVSHEIGHQFGANHTFNGNAGSCGQRSPSSAFEPGSGVTIMAYAGLCASQDLANRSIDNFHAHSIMEIQNFLGGSGSCSENTAVENHAPEFTFTELQDLVIPASTPFMLRTSAFDQDGDTLSYSWEQFDLGPAGAQNRDEISNGPIFRPFSPNSDSFRIFPKIENVLSGTFSNGEILTSIARELNFVVVVRDNNFERGAVSFDYVKLQTAIAEDTFKVLKPAGGESFIGRDAMEVRWNVAGTNISPFHVESVDFYLSVDGGVTYPHLIAEDIPNTGISYINLPNITAEKARIMVKAHDNLFFQINPGDFSITASDVTDGFVLTSSQISENFRMCEGEEVTFAVAKSNFGEFEGAISLNLSFNTESLAVDLPSQSIDQDTIEISVQSISGLSNGTELISVIGQSGEISYELPLVVELLKTLTDAPQAIFPANGQESTPLSPTLRWESSGNSSLYHLQLFADAEMTELLYEQDSLSQNRLELGKTDVTLFDQTSYYWRVSASNLCGDVGFSALNSFTTSTIICDGFNANNTPINIPENGSQTITAEINVKENIIVESIQVKLAGTHTYVSDLSMTLVSPKGTRITLIERICGSNEDFDLVFESSENAAQQVNCPMDNGQLVQPQQSFEKLRGENAFGIWKLELVDGFDQDGGQLQVFDMEICGDYGDLNARLFKPDNFEATYIENGQVQLNWDLFNDYYDGFLIYRKKVNGFYEQIANIQPSEFTYNDFSFDESGSYQYAIASYKGDEISGQVESTILDILSVTDAQQSNYVLYPNPVSEELHIIAKKQGQASLRIIDLSGRQIMQRKIEQTEQSILLSGIKSGVYFVEITSAEEKQLFKIIIQ